MRAKVIKKYDPEENTHIDFPHKTDHNTGFATFWQYMERDDVIEVRNYYGFDDWYRLDNDKPDTTCSVYHKSWLYFLEEEQNESN